MQYHALVRPVQKGGALSLKQSIWFGAFLLAGLGIASFALNTWAHPSGFPFTVKLMKPLGFHQQSGAEAPDVLTGLGDLQPDTVVRVVSATGALWQPGTYCNVEHSGERGFIRCDDPAAMKILVTDTPSSPDVSASDGGSGEEAITSRGVGVQFCNTVESCKAFCSKACRLDVTKWRPVPNDGATTCPGAPTSGTGIIDPKSPNLVPIPPLRFIRASKYVRATKEVVEGLKRLDDYLARSPSRAQHNYAVQIQSCYRPAIADIENECNFVLKAMHVLKKYPQDAQKRAEWTPKLNPNNLGLAWPGATPHSAGNACDMILLDSQGRPSFDWRVGQGSPHSSIDQRLASKMLDEAVTNDVVGGRRLNYEAWHYEWGSNTDCRCKDPECANKFWPPVGKPNCP